MAKFWKMGLISVVILLAALIFIPPIEGAGVQYTYGASSAVTNITFNDFYIDSFSVKVGETHRIEVPRSKTGYNLFLTNTGEASQEESLKTAIKWSNFWGVENPADTVAKYLGVTDFGYDNNKDTLNIYGAFQWLDFTPATSTAGASAAESLMHFIYWFSVPKR